MTQWSKCVLFVALASNIADASCPDAGQSCLEPPVEHLGLVQRHASYATTTLPPKGPPPAEPLSGTTTMPPKGPPPAEPLSGTTTMPMVGPLADESCANPTIYCGETVITDGVCEVDVFVKTPQVEFAINQHGTFGSEECPRKDLGFHTTSCSEGIGLGIVSSNGEPTFGATWAGDYFVPGVPYEGWQIRIRNGSKIVLDMEGSVKDSSNHGEGTVTVRGGSVIYTVDHVSPEGELAVALSYKPHANCTGISMTMDITTKSQMDPKHLLYFARSIVPDQGQPWGENYGTNQHVVSQVKGFAHYHPDEEPSATYFNETPAAEPVRPEQTQLVGITEDNSYSLVTAVTAAGRTLSLLSCNTRSKAGIGGYGFLYDLPNLVKVNMFDKKAVDAEQDIWTIWKEYVPVMGTTVSWAAEYLTRPMSKEERDALFCVEPKTPVPPPSASGDPHLVNIRGETFDIYKAGQIDFLRVPYQSKKEQANFTAVATIKDVSGSTSRCKEARYITSMLFGGAWLGEWNLKVSMAGGQMKVLLGGAHVKPSAQPLLIGGMVQISMPDETQLHVEVGEAKIIVSRDIQPVHFFLNVKATSLGKLGYKVGGLLGEDDNAEVSTPPAECRNVLLLKTPSKTQRSIASASI